MEAAGKLATLAPDGGMPCPDTLPADGCRRHAGHRLRPDGGHACTMAGRACQMEAGRRDAGHRLRPDGGHGLLGGRARLPDGSGGRDGHALHLMGGMPCPDALPADGCRPPPAT